MDWKHDIDEQANWEGLRCCPRCGSELHEHEIRGHHRPACRGCGYVVYVSPAPVTCVLVQHEDRVLLVRRKYPPGTGKWCLPAGFIEVGEHPSDIAFSSHRATIRKHFIETNPSGIAGDGATGHDRKDG